MAKTTTKAKTNGAGTVVDIARAQDALDESAELLDRLDEAPPPDADAPVLAPPKPRTIAIVGYTESRKEAPFDDPNVEIWGLNNLHTQIARGDRWFDLHPWAEIQKNDPTHLEWLRTAALPVYMWETHPEVPRSLAYPKDEIFAEFDSRYFTNSISWMVALALYEMAVTANIVVGEESHAYRLCLPGSQIQVYGVDMATDGEYAWQRPSCEYFLGVASGRGCKLVIPDTSDLLKTAGMYGLETSDAMRVKLESRIAELKGRRATYEESFEVSRIAMNQIDGALEDCQYWLRNWATPKTSRGSTGAA